MKLFLISFSSYLLDCGKEVVWSINPILQIHQWFMKRQDHRKQTNLISGTRLIDSNQPSTKQVKLVCQLHKILKFKLSHDSEIRTTEEAANWIWKLIYNFVLLILLIDYLVVGVMYVLDIYKRTLSVFLKRRYFDTFCVLCVFILRTIGRYSIIHSIHKKIM
jgi:hypothetical protein